MTFTLIATHLMRIRGMIVTKMERRGGKGDEKWVRQEFGENRGMLTRKRPQGVVCYVCNDYKMKNKVKGVV
jgi:hypothetical protein